jgi:small-conductance mechanosensitive channel
MADEVLSSLIVTAVTLAIAAVLTILVDRLLKKKFPLVRLLVDGTVWAVAIIFVLSAVGLRTDILLVLVAITGFLLAWSLKPLVASFLVQQTYLASAKPFTIGDYIAIEGKVGRVVAMSPFSLTLALRDGSLLLCPNHRLAEDLVIVSSRSEGLVVVPLKVGFEQLNEVEGVLPEIYENFRSELVENTRARLKVIAVRSDGVEATIELSVRNPNLADRLKDEVALFVTKSLAQKSLSQKQ